MPKYISGQNNNGLLADGEYPFEITSAKLKTSRKGSEMIEVTIETGDNGNTVYLRDFLVFDGGSFTSARIDQIRKAIGETILEGEEIDVKPSDLLHKTGRLTVTTEDWNNKKVNRVGSYLEPVDEIPGLAPAPKSKPKFKSEAF